MRLALIFATILIMLGGSIASAEVLTLEQCIEKAKVIDPGLINFRNNVSKAGATLLNRTGKFLPSFGVDASYSKSTHGLPSGTDDTLISLYPYTSKSYSAGYSLGYSGYNIPGQIFGYLADKASKRGAEYSFMQAESDLILTIKTYYYLVLKAKHDLDVARDAVARSEEILKLFEEKYELGSASLSEVLKQRVRVADDKLTLMTAENALIEVTDNLAQAIGMDPSTEFEIAELPGSTEQIKELSEYVKEARTFNPTLRASAEDLRIANLDVKSAWSEYLPTIGVSYGFSYSKETWSELWKFGPLDHSGRLSVSVSWNIFDNFSRERNLQAARADAGYYRAQEAYTRNEVIKGIREAWYGVKLAEETLQVYDEKEAAASEDMDLVQAKYNLGAAALWELLDAQVSLKDAQFGTVKAAFDYNLALAKLKNAMGE